MNCRNLLKAICIFIVLTVVCAPPVGAALFTTNAVIEANDFTYDAQDLVVSNCTLTIDGPHAFSSLRMVGGGVVTHSPAAIAEEHSLRLTISGSLTIDSSSKIDVSGQGYLPGRTFGNTTTNAASGNAGGSYGGYGHSGDSGIANPVYGDCFDPNELGSGSAGDAPVPGGGLIRITAASAQIDGAILANGASASGGGNGSGGGSGGGIRLDIGTLSGNGVISANGGNSYCYWSCGGAGGGGRVAIYYTTANGFDFATKVTAHGGGGERLSAVGTVYLKPFGFPGTLLLANHGTPTGLWTPLGDQTNALFETDNLVLSGINIVAATLNGAPVQADSVFITNGAVLTHVPTTTNQEYSLRMTITNELFIDQASAIDVSGRGYCPGYTIGNAPNGANGKAGGSYGGLGHPGDDGAANSVYGDYREPNELGSGSAGDWPVAGGGLVRIKAGAVRNDGAILADGASAVGGGNGSGGGSGGGIRLETGTLSGSGRVSANGGGAYCYWACGGAGGGGRIAIYYATASGFDMATKITAHGGGGERPSAAGTVYLKKTGSLGELLISSHNATTGLWTPLGTETDSVFTVDSLILSGNGVVVATKAGMPIQANSVKVTNAAVLTHIETTASNEFSLSMTVTNSLLVETNSRIDVSGRGYLPGHTSGNSTTNGASGRAGGSYGGLGNDGEGGTPNPVYGDYRNPNEPGSGGSGEAPVPGGGLIRISAGTAEINGTILANGVSANSGGDGSGAGSGGGIRLDVGTLSGSGRISADGGNGYSYYYRGGSGSGGRVALYYQTCSNFNPRTQITTHAGSNNNGPASVGTIYLHSTLTGGGELRLDSHGTPAGVWAPLGTPSDAVFEADTLIVSGAGIVTATVNGAPIQANNVILTNEAMLTHPVTTTNREFTLCMNVASNLWIDATSTVDVSGRGYLPGYTISNSTAGGASGRAGGSYGGLANAGDSGTPNSVYGDYRNPNELGSGSAGETPASGGGLVRINVRNAHIDGSILANGASAGNGGNGSGGGSGGGVRLDVETLSGNGRILANGGNGYSYWSAGGSGSGGRIAIYYTTLSDFNLATGIETHGGTGDRPGSSGTIYLEQHGCLGTLLLANHGQASDSWIPLGNTDDTMFQVDHLVVSGNNMVVATASGCPITATSITLTNGAVLTHPFTTTNQKHGLRLTVAETLTIDATSKIDVSGRGYLPGYTDGNRNVGGATGTAGGSYGGMGNDGSSGTANAVYGDYHDPNEPGSGSSGENPVSGGGLVRIAAGRMQLDGQIMANGVSATSGGNGSGGGSGGGILLDIGQLSGIGQITANGGAGYSYWADGGSGSGGRIAVYYETLEGFNLTNQIETVGGSGSRPGAVGTIYLRRVGAVAGELRIDNHGASAGSWTPIGLPEQTLADYGSDSIVISGTNVVAMPEHNIPVHAGSVTLVKGAMLSHRYTTPIQEYALRLVLGNNIWIDSSSRIDVSGRGYQPRFTAGNVSFGGATGNSGGSYGGLGGAGSSGAPCEVYGDYHDPNDIGSGSAGDIPVAGGGLVRITAQQAQIDGNILANGVSATSGYNGTGGGSGGGILLNLGTLEGIGKLAADGGKPYSYYSSGGGGGGGRIAVYVWHSGSWPATNATANGGGTGVWKGEDGSVFFGTSAYFGWEKPRPLLHGAETISWYALGTDPTTLVADISFVRDGNSNSIASSMDATSHLVWNTTAAPDGVVELRAVFRNTASQVIGSISRTVLVNNSAHWHSGFVKSDETWQAGTVHIVSENLVINPGVTVTVAPGTVVKFAKGTGITIQGGGILNALATNSAPIVFTALADDTVGGDSNLDGNSSRPTPGAWSGISVLGDGQFNQTADVEIRYNTQTHSGTLAASEAWLGTMTHVLNSEVIVPNGCTLTINPGAVVKFGTGGGLTIQSGGTLIAQGTVALPITFTSIKDDAVGGDSNRDGDKTKPAAGDWRSIRLSGSAEVALQHADVRYGGNSVISQWGAGGMIENDGGNAAPLTLNSCTISESLKDGILGGGSVKITNCVIRANDRGVTARSGEVIVVNSTIENNRLGLLEHVGVLTVYNSIVFNNLESGISHDLGTDVLAVSHCNVWNPGGANYSGTSDKTGQNGNISVDPKCKNAAGGDYRLDYRSPCIDSANSTLASLTDASGAPRYDDPRTPNTGVAGTNGAYADMGAFEFTETASSDINLVGTSVTGPSAVTAGETVTVQWTISNTGTGQTRGPWHDTVYLAPVSGKSALLAGEVLVGQGTVLGTGQSYTASATVRVPGGTEGAYLWQVRVNSRNDIFEGSNWTNNVVSAEIPTTLAVPTLTSGTPVSATFLAAGQPVWHKLIQPAGSDISLTLDAASADGRCRVYVGFGSMPDEQTYDQKNTEWNAPDALIGLAAPAAPRTVYLLIMPETLPDGHLGYSLAADVSSFRIAAVELARGANAGKVTVPIRGSGFTTNLIVELQPTDGGAPIAAEKVVIRDSANALATFSLSGKPTNICNVVARQQGLTSTLTDSFSIVAGTGGHFYAKLVMPTVVRTGRPFAAAVEFGNDGEGDVAIPLLAVQSDANYPLWFGGLSAEGTSTVLQFAAVGPEAASAGVLRPGEHYSITFYSKLLSGGYAPYSVSWIDGDSPDLQDWVAVRNTVRPEHPAPLWDFAWPQLVTQIGPTVGDYIAALVRATEEVRRYGLDYKTPDVLLWFLMEKAIAEFPDASLAGTLYKADVSHPLPNRAVQLTGPNGQLYTCYAWYNGAFAFRDLPAGTYNLIVPGYLPSVVETVTLPSPEHRSVVVFEGGQIAGHVSAAFDGSPVEGAMISVINTSSNGMFTAVSDSAGNYLVAGLPGGTYQVTCSASQYLDAQRSLTLSDSQSYAAHFSLLAGNGISGRVLSPSGQGVARAEVRAFDTASGRTRTTLSDSNGLFVVSGLAASTYNLSAKTATNGAGTTQGLLLGAGQSLSNVTLTLSAAASVTGFVYNVRSGLPVAGATIAVAGKGSAANPCASDAQGHYVLTGATPGAQQIFVVASNYNQAVTSATLEAGATTERDFALTPLGSIQGRVQTAKGTGLPRLTVALISENQTNATATTDSNGNFSFGGLANGTYELSVGAAMGMNIGRQTHVLSPTSNEINTTITLTGTEVNGTTSGADGNSVMGAAVGLVRDGQLLAETITDVTGAYRFLVFDSAPVDVVALSSRIGFQRLAKIPMSGGVLSNVNLTGGSSWVKVTLRGDSAPITNALTLLRAGTNYPASFALLRHADDNGIVGFENLSPGQYLLDVMAEGWAAQTIPVTLTTNNLDTQVTLKRGGILQGHVKNFAGTGVAVCEIAICSLGSDLIVGNAVTDASGFYRVSTLPLGEYQMSVAPGRAYAALKQNVTVSSTAIPKQLDVVLQTNGAVVLGSIKNVSGKNLIGARVVLRTETDSPLQTTSVKDDGTYRLAPVLPGAYRLTVTADSLTTTTNVALIDGEQTVDINAPNAAAIALPTGGQPNRAKLLAMVMAGKNGGTWFGGEITAPTRVSYDTETWRNGFYHYPPKNGNCKAYLDAKSEAAHTLWWLNYSYNTWEQAYQAMSETERANLLLLGARIGKMTAKMYMLIQTWPAVQAKLGIEAAADTKWMEAIGTSMAKIASIADDWMSPAMAGETPGLDTVGKTLFDTQAAIIDLIGQKVILGRISAIWDIINEIKSEADEMQTAFNDTSTNSIICLNAQRQYYEWVKLHNSAIDRVVVAAQQDCEDCKGDGCKDCPPPPPRPGEEFIPPPPAPKDPCCGQPAPCPPPCKDCGKRGGDKGGTDGRGSLDPNDKQTTGFGPKGMIQPGDRVFFLIRFENKTNATAAAQMVTITDSLDSNFDYTSLELLDLGFNNVNVKVPRGRTQWASNGIRVSTDPNPVRVTAGLDPDTGVLRWVIESVSEITGDIPEDPLSGFLPANDAEHRGEGYVSYSIKTKTNIANNVTLTNWARIVFDANDPIDTPVVTNTIDSVAPESSVQTLPPVSLSSFEVQWSALDNIGGSGIASYAIYVSTNGGAFGPWLEATTNTVSIFTGQSGSTYRFFSIARDNLGNTEVAPEIPDAQTRCVLPQPRVTIVPNRILTNAGANVVFLADADGMPPFQYQWRRNNTPVKGATNGSLVLTNVQLTSSGTFSVLVSNSYGSSINSAQLSIDASRPTLAILYPTPMLRVTNAASVTVRGKAGDIVGIGQVWYQLNGAAWTLAQTTNAWTNWMAQLIPPPGTNAIRAYAQDAAGNRSLTNSISFVHVVPSRLTLQTNGIGTITRTFKGDFLEVGRNYTVKAVPGTGQVFSNWIGSLSSSTANLTFRMQSNMVLTANFIPNPYIGAAGTYHGLFYNANQPAHQSGGFIIAQVSSNGALVSAKLQQGTNAYPLTGQFSVGGEWITNAIRTWSNTAVSLRLDLHGGDLITGTVSNAFWTSELRAHRGIYSTHNPAPQRGKYTLIVPGSESPDLPGGNSFGTVSIATNGSAQFSGVLADGSKVSQSTLVSKQGEWPLYLSLYSGKGSLFGWLCFTNESDRDIDGVLTWTKPSKPVTPLYKAGFTQVTEVIGSKFGSTNGVRLLNLTNGIVILENGNLPHSISNEFVLKTNNIVLGSNKLIMTITNSSGLFQGSVTNGAGKTIPFSGALLQKQNAGYGLFLSTNRSGSVYMGQ